ncbi:hypothetical protein [Nostoc sp. ChiQUE01b]|nr:hypothetical protein [Nostoc sp. ChiQUE01b]MDZ8263285.1 hypothetical protein [Nostoc sp. ChiQUE01b]
MTTGICCHQDKEIFQQTVTIDCAAYPTSIGLPTSVPSGRLSDNP